jgi:hypothetical protein
MPKQNAETRLRNSIEACTSVGSLRPWKHFATGLTGKPPNFDDQEVWANIARSAFVLRRGDTNLRRAFQSFQLDPRDPCDWRALLNVLVAAFGPAAFAARKRAGAKRKWTGERRDQLLNLVEQIQRSGSTDISDEDACRILIGAPESPPHIQKSTVGGLIKQLEFARRRRANRALGDTVANAEMSASGRAPNRNSSRKNSAR